MSKHIIHQEHLESCLRGNIVEIPYRDFEDWSEFDLDKYFMEAFDDTCLELRQRNGKVVEVNLTEFYKEYDSIDSVSYRDTHLEDLIEKYLPRPQ